MRRCLQSRKSSNNVAHLVEQEDTVAEAHAFRAVKEQGELLGRQAGIVRIWQALANLQQVKHSRRALPALSTPRPVQ